MAKKFKVLYGGECYHPERTVNKNGRLKMMKFPALFFFIELDSGKKMLFDTGYSSIFFEATKKLPFWIYRQITKVKLNSENMSEILSKINIDINEIDYIFISHFHPDHIGNLKAFSNAKFITSKKAYGAVKELKGLKALKKGFLKEHIPDNFEERVIFYEKVFTKQHIEELSEFESVYKLFNEELYAVEIEGHIEGHTGLFFKINEKKIFLIADAVWRSEEYMNLEYLPKIAKLVFNNFKEYALNLNRIHNIYKKYENILIIPSHCEKAYSEVKNYENFI